MNREETLELLAALKEFLDASLAEHLQTYPNYSPEKFERYRVSAERLHELMRKHEGAI